MMTSAVKTLESLEAVLEALPKTRRMSLGDAKRDAREAISRARASIDTLSEYGRLCAYRADVADKMTAAAWAVAGAVHAGMVQEISPASESVRTAEMRAVVNASA